MRARVTWRDDEAPHQIRLFTQKDTVAIQVSCTCRPVVNGYDPMAAVSNTTEAFRVFDNPRNHNENKGVTFTPGMRTPVQIVEVP